MTCSAPFLYPIRVSGSAAPLPDDKVESSAPSRLRDVGALKYALTAQVYMFKKALVRP
jgi:hypothetical protein